MKSIVSTVLMLLSAYCLHAQIAGEVPSNPDTPSELKMPDDETIRRIKQQALNTQFEFHYQQAVSQLDLRNALELLGQPPVAYGFGVEGGYYFDPVPLAVGGELGVYFNGADSKSLRSSSFSSRFELTSSNVQIPVLAHIRFQPNINSWLFPYAEVVAGFTIFSSTVTLRHIRAGDTLTDSDGNGALTWNYGVGMGLAIKVHDIITLPNTLQRTLFDVRVRYLWGSDTNIPHADLVDGNTLDYYFTEQRVATPQVVMFRAGFIFQL